MDVQKSENNRSERGLYNTTASDWTFATVSDCTTHLFMQIFNSDGFVNKNWENDTMLSAFHEMTEEDLTVWYAWSVKQEPSHHAVNFSYFILHAVIG